MKGGVIMNTSSCNFNKENFKQEIINHVRNFSRKDLKDATPQELYQAVSFAVRDIITENWIATHHAYDQKNPKMVYYLSMEFLTGRALGNNILNLTLTERVKEVLDELDIDMNLSLIEEEEADAGLGNGGLGRLAACFMDSLATLQYPAYGCGIRYKFGIFKQKIQDGRQIELPDDWLKYGHPWEVKRTDHTEEIKFGGNVRAYEDTSGRTRFIHENYQSVLAIPYDMPIVGYNNRTVNTLRLWDAEAPEKFILHFFDEGEYAKAVEQQNLAKTLTHVLYPNDNHYQGKELRLKQQYFFVSATLQRALRRIKNKKVSLYLLPEKVVFQMNDTHPSLVVPELMRILLDIYDLSWDDAWRITTKSCAYTNHTTLLEALEKWPVELFQRLLPRIYQIVEEINNRFCHQLRNQYMFSEEKIRKLSIFHEGQIQMANLAIVGSFSVNGVAALHSEILKTSVLSHFSEIMPEKFNNKTNGITPRRWLAHSNPELSKLITETIGHKWITDLTELEKLKPYAKDKKFQEKFMAIKFDNKVRLAEYIQKKQGIQVNPHSIFDVQVKRLHEYKRQLLNILHVMMIYNDIHQNPDINMTPRTFIFGAKAAPGYRRAKLIIKLINSVADLVNNDPITNNKLCVVFIENYNVSSAEIIIPATDVSEQISTAGKEASGTGNMKFMLNGAVTIGTLDGANVEIAEELHNEHIFIFGLTADEVAELVENKSYNPWDIYNDNPSIRRVLDQLIDGTIAPEEPGIFQEIYESLLNRAGGHMDEYFILKDIESYYNTHHSVDALYKEPAKWAESVIMNTASSGKFSSDRTVQDYIDDIWKLEKVVID